MATTEKLLEQILDLSRLEFWTNMSRFLAVMTELGYARLDLGMWAVTVGAGDSVAVESPNPLGYVWVPSYEGTRVSAENTLYLEVTRDDKVFLIVPGAVNVDFNWSVVSPYAGIIENTAKLVITNISAASQWMVGIYIGYYIQTDKYSIFRELLRNAASRHDPMRLV